MIRKTQGGNNVAAKDFSSASQGIIQVFVTRLGIDNLVTSEPSRYSPSINEWSLPAILPVKIKGETFWEYLGTGIERNFIISEAAKRLNLKPERHEVQEILTINGAKRQSMPIFNLSIESLGGKASENIQVTGTKLRDFTTARRPDINKLKEQVRTYQRQ